MDCPVCRTYNASGIKYCINCGRNLEDLPELSYGQVDKGFYHTEEEYSAENSGFIMSENTFTINDRPSQYVSENLFTSEELNSDDDFYFGGTSENNAPAEEFDFGGATENNAPAEEFDFGGTSENNAPAEEFDFGGTSENNTPAEEFDFGGTAENSAPIEEFDFGGTSENNAPAEEFDFGGTAENSAPIEFDFSGTSEETTSTNKLPQGSEDGVLNSQPYAEYTDNSVPLQAKPYNDMYGTSPQIIGYDAAGQPVYRQNVPYQQPQIMGYDMNGQPVYSQPTAYQPQFIGYDANGQPVYSQPTAYQPQIIGYDANGQPIYSQPVSYPQSQYMNFAHPSVYQQKKQSQQPEPPPVDEQAEKFRNFLDDGKNETPVQKKEEDFFGKTSEMGDVVLPDLDIGGLKKREKKKKVYMTDVEIQDAENLLPNTTSKFNQKYMRQASDNGSADLGEKKSGGRRVTMGETKNVDSRQLNPSFQYKSRIRMGDADKVQTDDFNTRTVKKRTVYMAEADHAVEAMPKKKQYVDELDLIELPDYMKARKKNKKKTPGMSEL